MFPRRESDTDPARSGFSTARDEAASCRACAGDKAMIDSAQPKTSGGDTPARKVARSTTCSSNRRMPTAAGAEQRTRQCSNCGQPPVYERNVNIPVTPFYFTFLLHLACTPFMEHSISPSEFAYGPCSKNRPRMRTLSHNPALFLSRHRPVERVRDFHGTNLPTGQRVRIRRFPFGAAATLSCCTKGDGTSSNAPKGKPRIRTLSHNPWLFLAGHRPGTPGSGLGWNRSFAEAEFRASIGREVRASCTLSGQAVGAFRAR